jgi:signal peptidase
VADAHRRRDALALLERVDRIRHAEATFEPLRGVQILAQALWEAINATLPPQIHADAGALADGTHPFAHLLELVERGEFVDDERWHVLEESTAANFGTPVSVAAARGRLRVVDAAITEPEPQPKPVEPVEAAPEPVEVPAPIAVQAVDVEPEIILPSLPAPVVEPQPLVALWQAEAGVDQAPRPRKSRPWLRAAAMTSQAAALLLAAAVTFVAVVPALFGARSLVVAGSSMEPSVPRGSVVFVQPMAPTNAHIGDVITFAVNGEANNLVTHRVVQVEQDDQGLALRTEGDANNTEDVWRVRASDTVGRVVLWVPMAGFVMAAASLPLVRIATVALLLMVLVAQLFRRRTSQPSSLPAPSLG